MRRQYIGSCKKRLSVLLSAACLCTLMVGCKEAEEEVVMSEVIPVQVQKPEAGKLTLKNEFMGTVSPEESVYVIPMVTAEVLSTNVSLGEEVNEGDVLCKLDSEAAQLQLASAKAQYDSAAAGVNSAEVGYEVAQAQYESTVAQLDAQMGGQKNLQMYQLQIQVDSVHSGIDDIYEQMSDLEEDKAKALEQKGELEQAIGDAGNYVNQANAYVEQARRNYEAAVAVVTRLEPGDYIKYQEILTEEFHGDEKAYNYTLDRAKEGLAAAQSAYDQANAVASQASAAYNQATSAYDQLESGIESIDDGREQLDGALADTYKSLEQAEAIKNITEEQVYSDTQKIVDANKKAAAMGLESAAAGINSAQVGVEGAQVAIESAEYQLDMYTLKAPISGVIEAVNVKEHDFASPNTPAYIISNKEAMTVTFYVSEGVRNTFQTGQKVTVDRNGKLFDGVITEIGSMVDQNTGLFVVKVSVGRPDESMLTGCSVKISADTYSQDNVLLIPYDAVYYDNGQPYVYVAVDGVVARRNIETGIFDEQTMTVVSGLTTEDQLITSWSANLREGAEVSIQKEKSAAAEDAGDEE
ncbi:MAG: efflux RND transporter periplasmic adaptor subunit [Lachnospiraceae bacterium]|nr:efflux RND transporter periplasmic adaptor subunit [Lachnospiraceae bacterium]